MTKLAWTTRPKGRGRTKEEAIALYRNGISSKEIAKQLGIPPSTARRWAMEAGNSIGDALPAIDLEELKTRVITLYSSGLNVQAIGRQIHRRHAVVTKWLREAGLLYGAGKNPNSRAKAALSDDDAAIVRERFEAGDRQIDIAQDMGVGLHVVNGLVRGRTYNDGDSSGLIKRRFQQWKEVDNMPTIQPITSPPTGGKVKHIVIPDTQVRADVPTEHLLWAGQYIAEQQPDVVVHLGDHWDLPSLSSYEKLGSKWFEGKRLRADIDAGNQALELLMKGMGDFRPKRMVMLRGNHEDRLTRAINDDPVKLEGLVSFADFNDTKLGWEVVDYQVPIEIDGLAYCHLFYNPSNGRPYSGAIDTMLRNIGGSFVMGHQQGLRIGRRELANGRTQRGLCAGSFYQHSEEYRGPQAAFEWRGILVLHEVANGNYDLMEVSLGYLRNRYGKELN